MSKPFVALESTVITHGLSYPGNLETARRLEAAVREEGAEPMTIAILDGQIRCGLDDGEIQRLARSSDAIKLNMANLAAGIASGKPGSTTVAATMFAAHRAGVRVFATGGIGGVHRGVADSFDISADLAALAKYPVAVVSAGAKAILDLPKTVEVLETLGVPVYGWQTDEFPAFYRRTSGLRIDARFDDIGAMAHTITTHWKLGLTSGPLICNPIPVEHELPEEIYTPALKEALAHAESAGVGGRNVTPYLLAKLEQITAGRSVVSNVALLENNARLAARLAVALTR